MLGYTLVLLFFLYYAVDIIFHQTMDALLGYNFVGLYYMGIPITLLGGLIDFIITIVAHRHEKE